MKTYAFDIVYDKEEKMYKMIKITYDRATKEAKVVDEVNLDKSRHMTDFKVNKFLGEKMKGIKK